jgi:hypothetical protein
MNFYKKNRISEIILGTGSDLYGPFLIRTWFWMIKWHLDLAFTIVTIAAIVALLILKITTISFLVTWLTRFTGNPVTISLIFLMPILWLLTQNSQRFRGIQHKIRKNFKPIWVRIALLFIAFIASITLAVTAASFSKNTLLGFLNQFRAALEPQLAIVLLLTAIGAVVVLVSWLLLQDTGLVVLPFELDGEIDGVQHTGRGVSDALVAELNQIKKLHEHPAMRVDFTRRSGSFLDLRPANADLTDRFSSLGNLNVASSTLQLGALALILKSLLPKRTKAITGSLQRYGSTLRVVARLESSEVSAFEATRTSSNQVPDKAIQDPDVKAKYAQVADMVTELAAKIAANYSEEKRWASLTLERSETLELSQYVTAVIEFRKNPRNANTTDFLQKMQVGEKLCKLLLRQGVYTAFEVYTMALRQYLRYATDLDPKQIRFLEETDVIPDSSLNELAESLEPARVLCLWLAEVTPDYIVPQRLLCRIGLAYLGLSAVAGASSTPNREECIRRARFCFERVTNDEVGPLASLCLGILEARVATTLEEQAWKKRNGSNPKPSTDQIAAAFAKARDHFYRATALNPLYIHGWFDLAVSLEKLKKYQSASQNFQEREPERMYEFVFDQQKRMTNEQRDSLSAGEQAIFHNWYGWYLLSEAVSSRKGNDPLNRTSVGKARFKFINAAMADPEDHHAFSNWALSEAILGHPKTASQLWEMAYQRCNRYSGQAVTQLDRLIISTAQSLLKNHAFQDGANSLEFETHFRQWKAWFPPKSNDPKQNIPISYDSKLGVPTWALRDAHEFVEKLREIQLKKLRQNFSDDAKKIYNVLDKAACTNEA